MHLRAPSIDQGVHAFAWSVVFFLYMWLGALAIDVPGGIAFILSLVVAGGDLPVRAHARRRHAPITRRSLSATPRRGGSPSDGVDELLAPSLARLVAQRSDEAVGEVAADCLFEAIESWLFRQPLCSRRAR